MRRMIRDDRGASIVFVALLAVAIIGLVGLAIDVGAMYAERRELGRGADAAALAIAEECALDGTDCSQSGAWAMADRYADDNADDGTATIHDLDLDLVEQRVQVTTRAVDSDGTDGFRLFFMRALGFDRVSIGADATAVWGYPSAGTALPLIISDCEYLRHAPDTDDAVTVTIFFHDGPGSDDCAAQAGQDTDGDDRLPGGFGWLLTGGDCSAEVSDEDWVTEDPGASPSRGCGPAELEALILDRTVAFPYFDDVRGLGSNGTYRISGVGAFHVTGYNFGGQYKAPDPSTAPCSGADRCIAGYFTSDVVYDGTIGGEDRGIVVVKLVG
jgi:hypothetical protein